VEVVGGGVDRYPVGSAGALLDQVDPVGIDEGNAANYKRIM